jgi:hypothetical protein
VVVGRKTNTICQRGRLYILPGGGGEGKLSCSLFLSGVQQQRPQFLVLACDRPAERSVRVAGYWPKQLTIDLFNFNYRHCVTLSLV